MSKQKSDDHGITSNTAAAAAAADADEMHTGLLTAAPVAPSSGTGSANAPAAAHHNVPVPPTYITDPGPDDVLLGRGAPIINYVGNVKFRSLVRSRKNDYITSGQHKIKEKVAKSIMEEIQRRGGRFLKRVQIARAELTESQKVKVYQIADYDVALEKVKQALRDKDADHSHLPPPPPQQQLYPPSAPSAPQPPPPLLLPPPPSRERGGLSQDTMGASGMSTLTALQRQLYDAIHLSNNNPSGLNFAATLPRSSMNTTIGSHLHSGPDHPLDTVSEFMRYQQLQSLNMLSQQLRFRESQQQDQQRLLSMLRTTNHHPNNESFQQPPLSPSAVLSLLAQQQQQPSSNHSVLPLTNARLDKNVDVRSFLLQRHHERTANNHAPGRFSSSQQQLPRVNSTGSSSSTSELLTPSNLIMIDRINHLAQVTNNTNLLAQQQQFDQYNAALLGHSASFATSTGTAIPPGPYLDNRRPDLTSRDSHTNLQGGSASSIGLVRPLASSEKPASDRIPLLTGGKIGEASMTTTKRKSKEHDDSSTPKSSTSGSVKRKKANSD